METTLYDYLPETDIKMLSKRFINEASTHADPTTYCELDSHANTCVAGAGFVLYSPSDRNVSVHPFSEELGPVQNIPIATVATVWTNPRDGQPYFC